MARSALWKASRLPRCRKCGRVSITDSGEVGVRVVDGHAGFAGLASCGSVWVCPVCSSKIMARRSLEIGAAVAQAQALGLGVAFSTLTMRHKRGQKLAQLWDGLAKGWGRCTSGKQWVAERDTAGLWGYVRVVETTHGRNGWHVHVHSLFIGENLQTDGDVEALMAPMWGRWSRGLQSAGLDAPLPVGSEWHLVDGGHLSGTALGEYLSKGAAASGAIGAELTQTQSKLARGVHSTRSHWQLLEDGPVNGEVAGLRLWWEWERASKGRRQIAWSQGLRQALGLGVEQSDEDIAGEQLGTADDTVVWITRLGWASIVARPQLIGELLTAAERLSTSELSAWLDGHGVGHVRV
jgi:Replication protein